MHLCILGGMLHCVGAVAAARSGALESKPKKKKELYRVPDVYEPSNEVGSVTAADMRNTETIVRFGHENVTQALKKSATDIDIAALSCAEISKILKKLELQIEKQQVEANERKFEAASFNAASSNALIKEKKRKSKHLRTTEADVTAKRANASKIMDQYEIASKQYMKILDTYTMKCGVTDKYCVKGQKYLLDEFTALKDARESAMALANEAGWLAAEAEADQATEKIKKKSELKFQEAWNSMSSVWEREMSLAAGINTKAAACGVVPPEGAWSAMGDGCGLKPGDPLMQAMLKEHPEEFYTHWQKEIGLKAGIDPTFVKVDILNCFGRGEDS